ncbi:MAG TPA: acyl carrier protein [Terriglobales bacterium]|nr:acyl carrier protein [Terriglobales bacterium]
MNTGETILNYIRTQLSVQGGSIAMDTNLTQEGQLDSTAMLELILWVGDTFSLSIQNEDFTPENFATPRNIVEFVERRRNGVVANAQPGGAVSALGND